MAADDWAVLGGGLNAAPGGSIGAGVTTALGDLPGGWRFAFAARSLAGDRGAYALRTTLANFAPITAGKGGVVSGLLRREVAGCAPLLYLGAATSDVTATVYMLGLGADAHLVLRKGRLVDGVPDVAPGTNGVLRRSLATFDLRAWVHVRLDAICNANGDVRLQCFRSDPSQHAPQAPEWAAQPGLGEFVDDSIQVATGSPALAGGYAGFGFAFSPLVGATAAVGVVSVDRQL